MLRSASARLAALYTAGFALAVVVLGWVVMATAQAALVQQFDARISADAEALEENAKSSSLADLAQAINARQLEPGALAYGLQTRTGQPAAGVLAGLHVPDGWSTPSIPDRDGLPDLFRVHAQPLPGGGRLLVGDDFDPVEDLSAVLLWRFSVALALVVLLGALGGLLMSRQAARRVGAITDTAEAIIDGDMSRRAPIHGAGDDMDRLAGVLNRMLDRIAYLMESLRQVSSDIAHDLRTPLTRLRQRLEALLSRADAASAGPLEAAIADLDSALETFAALLRIAQVESGLRRAGFREVGLDTIARNIVEAFAASAQDSGRQLDLETVAPVAIQGDAELLTQLVANLVENGIVHTPRGTRIRVRVTGSALEVSDDGPGVSEADRTRLFDRFYRPERSRSTPGAGLGLALVAAIARLHDATLELRDVRPGLAVRAVFKPFHPQSPAR